jgi:hypothetical protein
MVLNEQVSFQGGLDCGAYGGRLTLTTGKLQNNIWIVRCPRCRAPNRLDAQPPLGGKLLASEHKIPIA